MSSPEIELDRGDNEETGRNTYSLGSSSMNHREAPGMILEWTDKDSTVKSKHSVNLFSMSKVHWNVSDSNGLEMVQHMTSEAASMTAPSRVLKYRKTQEELGPDPTERSQQRNRITEGSYQRQAIQRTTKKEDQFLWDASDFNELEMIQHLFNPFLSTFMDDGTSSFCRHRRGKRTPWQKAGAADQTFSCTARNPVSNVMSSPWRLRNLGKEQYFKMTLRR
ncbi:hypothetical protein B0O80DRAFT_196851 [Mortierella sp. GBAus27b]|nr:hypothetical protein B0O80DRAFT_196851 [Mortierella sp. GBAus27b]